MEESEIIYTTDRKVWRDWLEENFETKDEVWFVFPMKESNEPSMSYNDAVEEALCYGWIDSTIKHIDSKRRAQRFTPRRKNSTYSRPNIERLIFLDKQGMIHPKIRKDIVDVIYAPYIFPEDIIDEIKKDETAWNHYQMLPDAYKRIRVAYIDAARNRKDEFKRRLENFILKTHENKIIKGFGGIEKYYNM